MLSFVNMLFTTFTTKIIPNLWYKIEHLHKNYQNCIFIIDIYF